MVVNKILIPVDFSSCSINAAKEGIALARTMSAQVILLHAYRIPVTGVEIESGVTVDPELHQEIKEDVEKEFDQLLETIPELKKVDFKIKSTYDFVNDAVGQVVEEENIGLIIMGTNGARGIDEVLIGSNAYNVIKTVKVPVIVIPEGASLKSLKTVVFTSDFRHIPKKETIKFLLDLVKFVGAKIHILHIDTDGVTGLNEDETFEAKQLALHFKGIPHEFKYLQADEVDEGILTFTEKANADLLAVMPRKHDIITKLFKRSITKKLAFHSNVPLLIIHSDR
ncbi:universal stress protein [Marinigracilibium pacificum]|uniref:Universal stress protein n=1 Tax=Marinigracilibium pacificum TaxID=2729599 RepID=A0A848J6K8_9BACT|nr:universal stress protein [Marinigracilibium pacificum]NMM50150.1 universal stress protein [Marinigracilibium pacificum]